MLFIAFFFNDTATTEIYTLSLHDALPISYIAVAIKERSKLTKINAAWVLRRAAMLADFNIENFIVLDEQGVACYDFRRATRDDWYCIAEYTRKSVRGRTGLIPVEEVKLKPYDKLRALELVGKHVDVSAFSENLNVRGSIEITHVERTIVTPDNPDR